jgi:hypothetical protein
VECGEKPLLIMAKKMALIPIEMLEQVRAPSLTPLTNPVKDQTTKGMDEMRVLLQDNTLPDDVKLSRYKEAVSNYSNYGDKLLAKSTPPSAPLESPPPSLFDGIPRTLRPPADALMGELEKYPEKIAWDRNSREVTINGRLLRGSNIVDLVGNVIRSRKNEKVPLHANEFLQTLAQLNVPEEFIKNKHQINKFRSLKGGSPQKNLYLSNDDEPAPQRRKKSLKKKPPLLSSHTGVEKKKKNKKIPAYAWKPLL